MRRIQSLIPVLLRGCAILPIGLAATATAQTAGTSGELQLEEVVVTGSRTIVNGNNSPTPVTMVTAEELQATKPSTIAEAVMDLPSFNNSRGNTALDNGSRNPTGAFINLRGFGIIRNLILMDGRRVPASAADGTVDTNTLPQMLMKRVDIVTGGASAVYGSDAITGVVNFILDDKFEGLKFQGQVGMSGQNDKGTWRLGVAGGSSFLDGRLHLEGSFESYDDEGIDDKGDRDFSAVVPCMVGSGTVATPYTLALNCRTTNGSAGGRVTTGPAAGMHFGSDGVLMPFTPGAPTLTATTQSGGDGAWIAGSSLAASLHTDQGFARADYDFTDEVSSFVQVGLTKAYNSHRFAFMPAHLYPATNFNAADNAYLSAAQRTQLGNSIFSLGKYWADQPPIQPSGVTTSLQATAGLSGKLGDFDWNIYYTHGDTELVETNKNNGDRAKYTASLDAVMGPGGVAVCRVTLTNPGLYPGCVPTNPFGPTSQPSGTSYWRNDTSFVMNNVLEDVGAVISGELFENWAGPVRAALSGEFQDISLTITSDYLPTTVVDCTGLSTFACTPNTPLWMNNVVAPIDASQQITEGAFEVTVPMLRDVPMAQSVDLNAAVRYAKYSVSGDATTWKLGLDWHVVDSLRFRGTVSHDIRAPALYDLYQFTQGSTAFTDVHLDTTLVPGSTRAGTTQIRTQGNTTLTPEEADTWTAGLVFTPTGLPGFSAAIDYYSIDLAEAINYFTGNNANNTLCEQSNGVSDVCSLFVRPFPFSNRSPIVPGVSTGNYPTLLLSEPRNSAVTRTHGFDVELNYQFNIGEGRMTLRALGNYQPVFESQAFSALPVLQGAGYAAGATGNGPKTRVNLMAAYKQGGFSVNAQTRWREGMEQSSIRTDVYADNTIPSHAVTDLNFSYDFDLNGSLLTTFLTIQNVLDKDPPIVIGTGSAGIPNYGVPSFNGDDVVGRYFTVGFRLKM